MEGKGFGVRHAEGEGKRGVCVCGGEGTPLTMAEKTKHTANSTELVPLAKPTAVHSPTTCR